jgi:hypothetical protein
VIDMGHRPLARTRWVAPLLVAAGAAALAIPSLAMATTRYAAPGGTAPDTMCTTPATPCSIGAAAGGPEVMATDEAVIAPGNYSDTDLDGDADQPMDHTVRITAGSVHGELGDRPVISFTGDVFSAFLVSGDTTLSDVEVDAPDSSGAISQTGGIVERVIARTSRGGSSPCSIEPSAGAVLRDSVCFTDGDDSEAVNSDFIGDVGTHTVLLRNVTAVATKPDSDGLFLSTRGHGVNLNVDAKSVIARGGANDVIAFGLSNFDPPLPNTGGNTTVTLDHSNYVSWSARADMGGGMAAVTPAGTGTNQTGAVVLAADGYHQIAGSGSEILDHGAVDSFSGTTDIDGQKRTLGQAPDIGADELAFPTTTSVHCAPNPIQLGMGPSRCDVTVSDTSSPPPVTFFGGVGMSSDGMGSFGDENECEAVTRLTPTQVGCTFTYTPRAAGIHHLTVSYSEQSTDEGIHDASQGSDALNVLPPPGGGPASHRKAKRCKKRHRHAMAAKKKCKKKKRR